ncbi:MAG: choice-of-anchor D domain-containing protein [Myxococcota bacterium]
MDLSLAETDPCSGVEVPRRVPDDYEAASLPLATDLGSRAEKVFEVRSRGSANLTITEVSLSANDPEYTLSLTDADGNPASLPASIIPNAETNSQPGLLIHVSYLSADAEPDLVNLVIKSDDPKRKEITFSLAAGRGKLAITGCEGGDCLAGTSSPSVSFGNVSRGMTAMRTLTIKDVGEGDLDLRDLRLESGSAELCAPEATSNPDGSDCTPLNLCKVLRPGEEYKVNIKYAPIDGGSDTGVLHVVSGDAGRGTIDIYINGTGAGPAICACLVDGANCNDVTSVDFGAVAVGATERRTIRLKSCGTEDADLTEAALEMAANNPFHTDPEFSISRAFSIMRLSPGAFAEGEISYAPTAPGTHKGGLRFSQSNQPSWIALIGRAATCDLQVLPVVVDFGTVAGGSGADRTVVMVNNGARACTVTAISDPANGFTIPAATRPALPLTVGPGASQNLIVHYTAPVRQTPTRDMSSFDVSGDNGNTTVQLIANGGGMPVCQIEVQPNGNGGGIGGRNGQLTFGATNIGYTKMLSIRVSNTGNTDCVLQTVNMTVSDRGEFQLMAPNTPSTIGAGTTADINVTFAPTHGGPQPLGFYGPLLNHVDFTVQGTGLTMNNWSIGINARPTVPTIDILPDMIDFGVITWDRPRAPDNRSSCGSETRSARIYNSGTGALDISSIEIDMTSDPVFLITEVTNGGTMVQPPYMFSIQPGGSAEVQLRFFPTRISPAVHNGLLVINNSVTTQSTVPLHGEGTANGTQTDHFAQLADNKVDILWVVDDSGSMSEEQTSLAQNFQSFITFADSLGADYQVGVTTTEINDAPSGKIWACNGFNKIIRSADANRVQAFQCAANVTSPPNGNSRPNPGGSDEQEAGLRAARIALEPPVRDADNAGFLRADARLAVIIVSDEEDQSPGSVSLYVDFFRNIKGFRNPQLTSVSAIAGDVPNGCATAEAGQRYFDAANQLNGQFESICSSSWASMLQRIGLGVFTLRSAWTLSRPADQNTISVRVNGAPVSAGATNGWTFDAMTNAIVFNGTSVPPAGATVDVTYGALCIP